MAIINITGGFYSTKSETQSKQETINWYPEEDPTSGERAMILMPTPGLKLFVNLKSDGSEVRGMIEHNGVGYVVVDDSVYTVGTNGDASLIATLTTSSGLVKFASTYDEIILVDGSKGYRYKISTTTWSEITDADFPSNPVEITAQDGYTIVAVPNSRQFQFSAINDATAWNATDMASAEFAEDNIVGMLSSFDQLWIFCQKTVEVWYDAGTTFPWQPIQGAVLQTGCLSAHTIAEADNSIFWLAQSRYGDGVICRSNGFNYEVISTRAINNEIRKYRTITDAYAYAYRQEGHTFYVITFPTARKLQGEDIGVTWVYDTTTGLWHERQSIQDTGDLQQPAYSRHRSNCYMYLGNKHIVGDPFSGKLYEMNLDTYDDNGDVIKRKRMSANLEYDARIFSTYNLDIQMETGVGLETGQGSNPLFGVRYSKDKGNTWSEQVFLTPGAIGEYNKRSVISRLGCGRSLTIEVEATDPVKWVLLGARADVEGTTD